MKHKTITTEQGVVHELISDFDTSDRVIVATQQDVAMYENRMAYEDGKTMPLCAADIFGADMDDGSEAGYVASIENGERYFAVIHTRGCRLYVTKA